jgi:hypothetical protein
VRVVIGGVIGDGGGQFERGLEVRLDRPRPVDTVAMQFNLTYFVATALHSKLSEGYEELSRRLSDGPAHSEYFS